MSISGVKGYSVGPGNTYLDIRGCGGCGTYVMTVGRGKGMIKHALFAIVLCCILQPLEIVTIIKAGVDTGFRDGRGSSNYYC